MIKIFKRFTKKEVGLLLVSFLFIVVQVWLSLKLPDYMTEMTKLMQTPDSTVWDVLVPGFKMLACALGTLASTFIVGYIVSYVAAKFSKETRTEVYGTILDFGMEEVKKFSTSSLITRTTNDITQVQTFIAMGVQLIIRAPLTAVWAIFKISSKSWQWSAVTGGAIVALMLLIVFMIVAVVPKFKIVQKLTDNLNKTTRENLTGLRVIRAFNAEKYQKDRFEKANDELTNTNLFIQRVTAFLQPFMILIMSGLTLAIYFIGSYLIDEAILVDKIDLFSNMVVFSSYAMQIIMAFMMMAFVFILYPRASVSSKRLMEVLETKPKILSGTDDIDNINSIEFKDVEFKYEDAEESMLNNINFKINKGETVAFIGSTGSGKSTLINLIPRFYDVSSGELLINGKNIKEYDLEKLYNKIGYISQKAVLFTGTVSENVEYGKEKIDVENIEKSLEVAQASFVEEMENKYDSHISQGGKNVSGGQKQRLSIARAVAKNPDLYIFDDSFSALDYKTDYKLRKDLKDFTKDATTIIVAQRIGTIKNADKIIVLDEGNIVGIGKHKELLKNCDVYSEIALSQLSKEELENA